MKHGTAKTRMGKAYTNYIRKKNFNSKKAVLKNKKEKKYAYDKG